MAETYQQHRFNPDLELRPGADSVGVYLIAGLFLAAALFLATFGQSYYALLLVAALVAVGLALNPRITFFLFLAALFIWFPYRMSGFFAVHLYDLLMAVLFAGIALDFLLHTRTDIRPTGYDWPFIVLIIATIISALYAFDPRYSIVPSIRIAVIYLAFRAVYKFGREIGVRRIILYYIYLVVLHSLINAVLFFIYSGQTRVFGPAFLGYETFSMTALPMALAFLIWAETKRERMKFGLFCLIIGFGILTTQSRAPLLAVVIAIPALVFFATLKARREGTFQTLKTLKWIFIPVAVLGMAVIVLSETLFSGSIGRYEDFITSLTKPMGTVQLRLILWKAAIIAFLDNPITGVGIGNFRILHNIYPELKVVPLWTRVHGMSAHNVILHYLAETGLVGSLALVVLAVKGYVRSYHDYRERLSARDNQVAVALFIAMFVFVLTILYMRAWTWGQGGYIMAFLFGLTAAWRAERAQNKNEAACPPR